jgi:YYY domain-containing protein
VFSGGSFDLLVWLLVIELLSFAVFPFVASAFGSREQSSPLHQLSENDYGFGVSKVIGILVFGLVTWLPSVFGIVEVTRAWVTVCFLGILTAGYLRWINSCNSSPVSLNRLVWRNILPVEATFLGISALFLAIRYLNPEIFWGEKPMDSTFLHFFARNESFPPQDPWGSGHQMSYYYLGIYFVATLLKLTGIPVAIGYNLAIATLGGLIGAALYTLLMQLTKARITAVCGALAIVLASDPEVLRLAILEGRDPNFDLFWASTRVMTSPHFYEYTSWSLLFADLHAHVISIPFTVALLACGVGLFRGPENRFLQSGVLLRVLLGLTLGSLYAINTWDVLTFGAVAGLLVLLSPVQRFWTPPSRPDGSISMVEKVFAAGFPRMVAWIWDGLTIGLPALLVALPYSIQSGAKNKINRGWAAPGEFNELGQLLLMIGYWLGLILLSTLIIIAVSRQSFRQLLLRIVVMLLATIVLLLVPLGNPFAESSQQPWGLLTLGAVFAGGFCSLLIVRNRRLTDVDVPAYIIGGSAAALVVILEQFFLIDRMNTIFKGYVAVWMLFSIAAVYLVHRMVQCASVEAGKRGVVLAALPVIVLFIASSTGTALNCLAVATLQRVPTRMHTLDGAAYLDSSNPGDALTISWLNHFVDGSPTLLEAWGGSYREFTRISMHTGLPTVLGWEHHVQQRGLPHSEFQERKDAIRTIYTTSDLLLTQMLLLKYRVEFIVVGEVEKSAYSARGYQKFADHPELFKPVVSGAGTTLYVTNYSKYYGYQSSTSR